MIDPADIALCASADTLEPAADPGARDTAADRGSTPISTLGSTPASTPGSTPISTPISMPIEQSALFTFPDFASLVAGLGAERQRAVYSRGRNPTVAAAERKLAALERGEACLCFGSGMAAISAVLLGFLRAGDHVVFVNHVYGPTLELAAHMRRFGIEHDVVLDGRPETVERTLRPTTRLLWLESPGTMLFGVLDVPALASLARGRGILTCLDNSWATPLLQKPLALGVDVVVHSASKYLAGHSDLMAGAVVSTAARIEELFHGPYMLHGGVLAPFDAWLLLRGLKTLPARLRQHGEDALSVAEFLRSHPAVREVFHPAFAAARDVVDRQLAGYSGLLSFALERDDFEGVSHVLDALRVIRLGVSWGGPESLALSPNHGGDPSSLDAQGIPRGLIRLSVGLEGADTLIHDLYRALGSA